MEEIDYTEYGSCPNCNAQWIHISQLGNENGVTCCIHCYQKERENQDEEQSIIQHKPILTKQDKQ